MASFKTNCCTNSSRYSRDVALRRCPIRGSMREKTSHQLSAFSHQLQLAQNLGRRAVTVAAVTVLGVAASAVVLQPPDAEYVQSFNKWKAELVQDLKQNWLVLAGLFWLKPGEN